MYAMIWHQQNLAPWRKTMPIPDNLQKMAEEIGFGRAFIKLYPTLPEDIWEELTFKQCVCICFDTQSDEHRLKALKRMREIGSLEDWRQSFFIPLRNHTKLLLTAVKQMWRLSKNSGKISQIHRVAKDAFAIGRLAKDFNGIGQAAKKRLSRDTTRNQ